jgi:endonuclease-3
MKKKQSAERIIKLLEEYYGCNPKVSLDHRNAWELLVATILSAQCTDARVNMVTPALFQAYQSVYEMKDAKVSDVEELIRPVGFYHAKARNLILCAEKICKDFGGNVPKDIKDLTSLAGVGRKTANVIRGNVYHEPSIVVDTHVKRISKKLGLTTETEPERIEYDLMKVLPEESWIMWNIWLITLGREICIARRPKCEECPLRLECPSRDLTDEK